LDINDREITVPVSLVDIFPTLLDEVGIDIPQSVHGQSLVPLYRTGDFEPTPVIAHATSPGDPDTYYTHSDARTLGSVRNTKYNQRYKYIWSNDGDEVLYDLETDPSEAQDISSAHPEIVTDCRDILFDTINPRRNKDERTELETGVEKQLRELGYLE
jgi:arylsulfatase A-like enzyme